MALPTPLQLREPRAKDLLVTWPSSPSENDCLPHALVFINLTIILRKQIIDHFNKWTLNPHLEPIFDFSCSET